MMMNAMQWQPWAGLNALPKNVDLLFRTIQHSRHNQIDQDTPNWIALEMGLTSSDRCEIYPYGYPWVEVEDDGKFYGGRVTHYAVITQPESAT